MRGHPRRVAAAALTSGAFAALPLLAGAAPAAPPVRIAPGIPGAPSYKCVGRPVKLFDNTNGQSASGGGKAPVFSTRGRPYCVLSISTRHSAAKSVSVGLQVVGGRGGRGNTYGPLPALGHGSVWTASVPAGRPFVVAGTYACRDSVAATWLQNAGSRGLGFCTVYGTAAVRTKAPPVGKPAWVCSGTQVTIFDNSNGQPVQNNALAPLFNTWRRPNVQAYCLTQIRTYHWNAGTGATPGSIGLRKAGIGLGQTVPRRAARGTPGQGGVANVNWEVDVPLTPTPTVIAGFYRCDDSDPSTWSWNQQSKDATTGARGFCTVLGVPANPNGVVLRPGLVIPTPRPTTPPAGGAGGAAGGASCAPGVPTDFLVSPDHAAAGGATRLLLACSTAATNGFTSRLMPIGAPFMIGAGCDPFWTYAPGTAFVTYTGVPGQPCAGAMIPLPFVVVSNTRIDVAVPNGTAPGRYVVYVAWTGGDAKGMNDLTVP